MKNYIYNDSCMQLEALSVEEMIEIEGGSFAYELGRFAGEVVRAAAIVVCVGALLAL